MKIRLAEADYLSAVIVRLRELLGDRLIGVYPTGSVALDGYRPGRSDLDLIAVAEQPTPTEVAGIAAGLAHDALPCPATGLEFVLYDRATLGRLTTEAGFALNLNTGRELPPKVETSAGDGPRFWYPIDRDITHQQGQVLTGPDFGSLAARQPFPAILDVVTESVAAHLAALTEHGDNAVLNGCRSLRFHAERRWTTKPDAATWASTHAPPRFAALISAALESFGRDRAVGHVVAVDRAGEFLGYVLDRLRGSASS